jgi:glutamate--cysteine ligase
VHFNYSFPQLFWEVYAQVRHTADSREFRSAGYFDLLRNYRRHGWLVLYLFGVSPTVSRSFLDSSGQQLPLLDKHTAWEPYGTTLRMSDIGYRNRNQAAVDISVNSLDEYVRDLRRATDTPFPEYEKIGVLVNGDYRQLTSNILQIENEYYSYIRPKRVTRSGERPSTALHRAGVEYVEVRALDVSVLDPVGVNLNKMRFLEAFLAMCVLRDSPPQSVDDQHQLDDNHLQVARRGREPGLMLQRDVLTAEETRALASIETLNARILQMDRDGEREVSLNRDAAEMMEGIPLFIDDTGGISISQLAARARRLQRTSGLDLLIIDYLQLITSSGGRKSDGRVQEVARMLGGVAITQRASEHAREMLESAGGG